MRDQRLRKRIASRRFVADDDDVEKTITTLEEQLSDEITDDDAVPPVDEDLEVPVINDDADDVEADDDADVASIMAEADALLASYEAGEDVPAATVPDDKEIISKECDEIAARIAKIEEKDEEKNASKEVKEECDEVAKRIASLERRASEENPGIEDKIGDEAHGGDPSVSELPKTKIDCATDKEVFPTNSEYVANITKRLDRVANILEKRGMKRLAFRVDQLSDKLESSVK